MTFVYSFPQPFAHLGQAGSEHTSTSCCNGKFGSQSNETPTIWQRNLTHPRVYLDTRRGRPHMRQFAGDSVTDHFATQSIGQADNQTACTSPAGRESVVCRQKVTRQSVACIQRVRLFDADCCIVRGAVEPSCPTDMGKYNKEPSVR
jgi:hypothetical protein